MKTTLIALAAATLALPGIGLAQGISFSGGGTITTNYVYLGQTQSANGPAIQGYVEGMKDGLYLGVWASTVKLGSNSFEVDPNLGYRGQSGQLTYDLNFANNRYNATGTYANTISASFGYPVTSLVTLSPKVRYDLTAGSLQPSIKASYDFSEKITFSGTYGHDQALSASFFDVGASYKLANNVAVDGRYYKNSASSGLLALSLSFTTGPAPAQ